MLPNRIGGCKADCGAVSVARRFVLGVGVCANLTNAVAQHSGGVGHLMPHGAAGARRFLALYGVQLGSNTIHVRVPTVLVVHYQ